MVSRFAAGEFVMPAAWQKASERGDAAKQRGPGWNFVDKSIPSLAIIERLAFVKNSAKLLKSRTILKWER